MTGEHNQPVYQPRRLRRTIELLKALFDAIEDLARQDAHGLLDLFFYVGEQRLQKIS